MLYPLCHSKPSRRDQTVYPNTLTPSYRIAEERTKPKLIVVLIRPVLEPEMFVVFTCKKNAIAQVSISVSASKPIQGIYFSCTECSGTGSQGMGALWKAVEVPGLSLNKPDLEKEAVQQWFKQCCWFGVPNLSLNQGWIHLSSLQHLGQ